MDAITLTPTQLSNLLQKDREITVRRTLEAVGMMPLTISLTEAKRLATDLHKKSGGRASVDRAIKNGTLKTIKKGGKTAPVRIIRAEFDNWILTNELLTQ